MGYRQVESLFYLFIFLIYRKVNEKFAEETLKALRGMEKVTLIFCLTVGSMGEICCKIDADFFLLLQGCHM